MDGGVCYFGKLFFLSIVSTFGIEKNLKAPVQ